MKMNIFKKKCKYCEIIVDDYVDNRLNKPKEKEFLDHIDYCLLTKKCNYCKKLINDFTILKSLCGYIGNDIMMPDDLKYKLFDSIKRYS
jgi:hypothetical protein